MTRDEILAFLKEKGFVKQDCDYKEKNYDQFMHPQDGSETVVEVTEDTLVFNKGGDKEYLFLAFKFDIIDSAGLGVIIYELLLVK